MKKTQELSTESTQCTKHIKTSTDFSVRLVRERVRFDSDDGEFSSSGKFCKNIMTHSVAFITVNDNIYLTVLDFYRQMACMN